MDENSIKDLSSKGHVVGLHSFSHPTELNSMNQKQQQLESIPETLIIRILLGESPISMSHPCNSYNADTLKVLKKLGIKIGFRSNFEKLKYSKYEYPRIDHTELLREIN